MHKKNNKHKVKMIDLLKANPKGITISDIMKKTKLARPVVISRLHRLIENDKVGVKERCKKIKTKLK